MMLPGVGTSHIKQLTKANHNHARAIILMLLLVVCLGALFHANHVTHRDCISTDNASNHSTGTPKVPQIGFAAIVSMQRTASTWLAGRVIAGGNPCALSLNAIFSNSTSQSGNAWKMEGPSGPVQDMEPDVLVDFLVRIAQRKCADKLTDDTTNQCHNKCLVAFKEFDFHLTKKQHTWLWNHTPNMTVVVLERNVHDRYTSKWVAAMSGDWNTKGSYWHAEKVAKMVPNILPSDYYCKHRHDDIHGLCHFEKKHKEWFDFVRSTLAPNERVELSFDDTVQNEGSTARDKIHHALPAPLRDLLTPMNTRVVPQVALVAVASMRRSASTWLLKTVLVKRNPCAVSLGDVFVNNTDKSEDAWLVEGANLHGSIHKLEPSLLVDFIIKVAQRKCADKLLSDLDNQCRNKCIVSFKEFREHLSLQQHGYLWRNTPNLTVVVLERHVQERWRSRWIAAKAGDWDTTGSSQHKQVIQQVHVPPMNISESKEICQNNSTVWSHLCHFEGMHRQWYNFLREQVLQDERVEVSFDDTVLHGGIVAYQKIANGLPGAFRYLALANE